MSAWDVYSRRIGVSGTTKREAMKNHSAKLYSQLIAGSLAYQDVVVDGEHRQVEIIGSDNLNEKWMISLPGEDFDCGGLVEYEENFWIIQEKDASNEFQARVKLLQCNYVLKWVDDEKNIIEQWCAVEDGTKYLTGNFVDRNFVTERGDSRIAITLPKNDDTSKLGRNRRFIVDDSGSDKELVFELTKPLKAGLTYQGKGVYKFVLQEVASTDADNMELGIADYYKYFPRDDGTTVQDINSKIEGKAHGGKWL